MILMRLIFPCAIPTLANMKFKFNAPRAAVHMFAYAIDTGARVYAFSSTFMSARLLLIYLHSSVALEK